MFTFLDSFKDGYKRIQTDTHKKILRCFPRCRPLGHRKNGICGSPIRIKVSKLEDENIIFWSTFVCVNSDPVALGDSLPKNFFEATNTSNPRQMTWLRGVISPLGDIAGHIVVQFAPLQSSWVYSWWSSHRSKSNTSHCFFVVGCIEEGDTLVVRTITHSPSFQLYSKSHAKHRSEEVSTTNLQSDTVGKRKRTTTSSREGTRSSSPTATEKKTSLALCMPCKDSLTLQQQRNLTLDRLTSLCFHPETLQEYTNRENFRNINPELEAKVEEIDTMFEDAFMVVRFDERLDAIVNRWVDPSKMDEFKALCSAEMDNSLTWTPAREYDAYDPENGVERSFYAQFREAYRSIFESAILIRGHQPEYFFDTMQFLSENGLLHNDPFHPPSVENGQRLHIQIHGNVPYAPADYCAGCEVFDSCEAQARYAKDLLFLNRYSFQRKVFDSIREKLLLQQLKTSDTKTSVLDALHHINGVWIEKNSGVFEGNQWYPGVMGKLAGSNMGRMLRVSVSKISIDYDAVRLILRTLPVFSLCISYVYILDGVFHPFSPNHPISQFPSTAGVSRARHQYVGFAINSNRTVYVFQDCDVWLSLEKIQEWYPKFRGRVSNENNNKSEGYEFGYFRCITFQNSDQNTFEFHLVDYFIPQNVFHYSVAFVKSLIDQGSNSPYWVCSYYNTYLRFVMESDFNHDDVVDLFV